MRVCCSWRNCHSSSGTLKVAYASLFTCDEIKSGLTTCLSGIAIGLTDINEMFGFAEIAGGTQE